MPALLLALTLADTNAIEPPPLHPQAARYLLDDLGVEKLGVVAFCIGTHVALKLAVSEPRVGAVAMLSPTFIGAVLPDLDEEASALKLSCPLMAIAAKWDPMERVQMVSGGRYCFIHFLLGLPDNMPTIY